MYERLYLMPHWITRSVIGIVLATFFSDVGHEMVTAVLPLYLGSMSLGVAALGVMEGLADLLGSMSKLAGGIVGHHVQRKKPLAVLGYLVTTLGTGGIAFANSLTSLLSLRTFAWMGRGFRSPLRDFMLSDEVEASHFAKAYGIERAADMLGAVVGPIFAAFLVWKGLEYKNIILISVGPSLIAVGAILFLTRDRSEVDGTKTVQKIEYKTLPKKFWWFLGGVTIFGLGDFSRTFLIFLAARTFGGPEQFVGGMTVAVLLYALHNLVSALAAYPSGHLGDKIPKGFVLAFGYALGVGTNVLFALKGQSTYILPVIFIFSGIYIAIQETIEKAAVAEMLPRESRSFGFGVLACANAVGDMVASLFLGVMLARGSDVSAFLILSVVGAIGTIWIAYRAYLSHVKRIDP